MVSDRRVPPMPPFTTLEALQREHERLRMAAADGMPDPDRRPDAWAKHLAKVLPIRPGVDEA